MNEQKNLGASTLTRGRVHICWDLQSVLKEQWVLFDRLYKVANRNAILGQVTKINAVRNRVMHPIRDSPPTNGDFDELKDAYATLELARKRFYGAAEANIRSAK